MMKKVLLTLLIISMLFVPFVIAEESSIMGTLTNVGTTILDIGSLKFLNLGSADNYLFGFMRICIAVVVFTLLYLGMSMIPGMQRSYAVAIGIVLAIISVVFMPSSVLAAMGGTYALVFSFLLIGVPIAAVGLLIFATPTPHRWVAALKLGACLFMLWLFNAINSWAIQLMGSTVGVK